MLLSHPKWPCMILPALVAATPQQNLSGTSQVSLPEKVQSHVPHCAQPCLLAVLANQFPLACTVPSSISCLCATYSKGGQSLGEIALGCLYTSCPSVGREADEAYNICFGQTDAVKPTLTALTVMAPTSSQPATMSTSSYIVSTPSLTTALPTISSSSSSAPTETVNADSVPSISLPTATASPSQSSVASAAERPQTMKAAQIVGLSVAAIAAFIIALGLVFLSIFLRKRREKRNAYDFHDKSELPSPLLDGPSRSPLFFDKNRPLPELPIAQFPVPPTSVRKTSDDRLGRSLPRHGTGHSQPSHRLHASKVQSGATPAQNLELVHPLLRQGSANLNTTHDSQSPPNQIGLAITAELPKRPVKTHAHNRPLGRPSPKELRKSSSARASQKLERPDSAVTQCTVFEEDEVADVSERRAPSALSPALPVPPIRSLQPSRPPPPKFMLQQPAYAPATQQSHPRHSDLFLDIPIRQSKIPSSRIIGPSTSKAIPSGPSTSMAAPTSNTSNGDIPDYYFTSHKLSRDQTQPGSPQGTKDAAKTPNPKLKLSSSNVSRATSRASTTMCDAQSSRTSFESVETDDPTPESDDNKQLSPVAESPISNLRYPRVPRASNQLVPRSPASPQSQTSRDSSHGQSEPSSLLLKRLGEQGAHEFGGLLQTGSPGSKTRGHTHSNSMEALNPVRVSERSIRTQSGVWPPKSPAMYEPSVIRPLSIRPKQQLHPGPREAMEALKSPAWVTDLTPTRQGEDLLISVTYSKAKHR